MLYKYTSTGPLGHFRTSPQLELRRLSVEIIFQYCLARDAEILDMQTSKNHIFDAVLIFIESFQ